MAQWSGGFSKRPFSLVLDVNPVQVDQANNRTLVSFALTIVKTGAYNSFELDPTSSWSLNIGGNVWGGAFAYDFRAYNSLVLFSGQVWLSHDANGFYSGSASASASTNVIGSASCGGAFILTRIPKRPSKPAAPTVSGITSGGWTTAWTAPANNGAAITGYQVQWDDDPAFGSPTTVSDSASPYVVTGQTRATTYRVRVRAQNSVGWSDWSNPTVVTTLPVAATAPQGVAVSQVTPDSARATWTAPADNGGSAVTAYRVRVYDAAGTTLLSTVQVTGLFADLTGLAPGTTYQVGVEAQTSAGWGAQSDLVPFTTLSPVYWGEGDEWVQVIGYLGEAGAWTPVRIMSGNAGTWVG